MVLQDNTGRSICPCCFCNMEIINRTWYSFHISETLHYHHIIALAKTFSQYNHWKVVPRHSWKPLTSPKLCNYIVSDAVWGRLPNRSSWVFSLKEWVNLIINFYQISPRGTRQVLVSNLGWRHRERVRIRPVGGQIYILIRFAHYQLQLPPFH